MSVTIVTPQIFRCRTLQRRTIFALGREKGWPSPRAKGVDVIVVDSEQEGLHEPGVSAYFEITDPSFSFSNKVALEIGQAHLEEEPGSALRLPTRRAGRSEGSV